jgi:hypothetical protein
MSPSPPQSQEHSISLPRGDKRAGCPVARINYDGIPQGGGSGGRIGRPPMEGYACLLNASVRAARGTTQPASGRGTDRFTTTDRWDHDVLKKHLLPRGRH